MRRILIYEGQIYKFTRIVHFLLSKLTTSAALLSPFSVTIFFVQIVRLPFKFPNSTSVNTRSPTTAIFLAGSGEKCLNSASPPDGFFSVCRSTLTPNQDTRILARIKDNADQGLVANLMHLQALPLVFNKAESAKILRSLHSSKLIFKVFIVFSTGRVGHYNNIFIAECFFAALPGILCYRKRLGGRKDAEAAKV